METISLTKETALAILMGAGHKYRKIARAVAVKMNQPFAIDQRGVEVTGNAGDYLVLDAEGEPYVCTESVFEKSYRPVGARVIKTTEEHKG